MRRICAYHIRVGLVCVSWLGEPVLTALLLLHVKSTQSYDVWHGIGKGVEEPKSTKLIRMMCENLGGSM